MPTPAEMLAQALREGEQAAARVPQGAPMWRQPLPVGLQRINGAIVLPGDDAVRLRIQPGYAGVRG